MKSLSLKVVLLFVFGASLGIVSGLNPVVMGVGTIAVQTFAMSGLSGIISANGIDVSSLSALLSQFVKVPQNAAAIWYRVIGELELSMYTRKISGQTGRYAPLSSSNTELIQAFQKAFTPKGQVAFTPYINDVFRLKVDYLLDNIDEIVDGYAQFLYDEKLLRKDWPIVKHIVEKHLIPGIVADLNVAMCTGVFVAPTPGTAGAASGSMNGLFTIVKNEVLATNLVPIVTGVTTGSNAIDNVNTFLSNIPEADLNSGLTVFVSKTVERYYREDRLNTYGLTDSKEFKNGLNIDLYPTVKLVGLVGAGASQRMIATPSGANGNLLHTYDKVFLPSSFDVQPFERSVKMLTDFHCGTGFNTLDLVYTNDQN